MPEQDVIKILNQLSETGNKAFEVLVQQAIFDAWFYLAIIVASFLLYFFAYKNYNNVEKNKNSSKDDKETATIIVIVVFIVMFIVICSLIYPIIVGFVNPEYKAIEQLLRAL